MKKLFFAAALTLASLFSFSQTIVTPVGSALPNFQQLGTGTTKTQINGAVYPVLGIINGRWPDTATANANYISHYPGAEIVVGNIKYIRSYPNADAWIESGNSSTPFNGNRIITRDFTSIVGVNLGTSGVTNTLEALLYPSQVPTAALSGGGDYELHSAGTFGATLSWTAGRQASTNPISTIVVGGVNQAFSQPSAPGTVSGAQAKTITWNTNVGFANIVTTTDSKTASASTAFNFYPKRYWGYTTTSPPSSASIVAALGGGGELTTSKSKSTFSIVVTGTNKYVYYAYPSSYGALSSIIISGLESIGAFVQNTVSVTNASGYVQNYLIYTSNNLFNNTTINFNSCN